MQNNNNRSILISSGISLVSIIAFVFYLGAKSNNLDALNANYRQVAERLSIMEARGYERDIQFQKITDSLNNMQDDISAIRRYLNENHLLLKGQK